MNPTASMLERIRVILGGDAEKGNAALNQEEMVKTCAERGLTLDEPVRHVNATQADKEAARWWAEMRVSDYAALAQLELLERLTVAVESIELAHGDEAPRVLQPLPECCPVCDAPPVVEFRTGDDGGVSMRVGCSRYDHPPAVDLAVENGMTPDWVEDWNATVRGWREEFE